MTNFTCKCGETLQKKDNRFVCASCGSIYLASMDDKGEPFVYQPIEKKYVETGRMIAKAAAIRVNEIAARPIRMPADINNLVAGEITDLDRRNRVELIRSYLSTEDWDKVDEHIAGLLAEDRDCAEARWYAWLRERKAKNEWEMVYNFTGFTPADGERLDRILQNASPYFAKRIVNLFLDEAYTDDHICSIGLSVVIPYARNELVFSAREYAEKLCQVFERVIGKTYERSFLYLIENTLYCEEVDRYLDYVIRFGDGCTPAAARKYYRKAVEVDPGNLVIHRKLLRANILSDTPCRETILDAQRLFSCSDAIDRDVELGTNILCSEGVTTANKSEIMWNLLSYHSAAPEGLKEQLLAYGNVLLESKLWLLARDYFHLVLSFDLRCGDAYWGLCLAQLQAQNGHDAISKNVMLKSCPAYDKALAVYSAAGDQMQVSQLKWLSQQQKDHKKTVKGVVLACAGFLAISVLLVVLSLGCLIVGIIIKDAAMERKYSEKNVQIVLEESQNISGPVTELDIRIRNGCREKLDTISMTFYFYDGKDKLVTSTQLSTYCDMWYKDEEAWTVTLHESVVQDLEGYSMEDLKITVAITQMSFFSSHHTENLGDGRERILKKAEKSAFFK